MRNIARYGLLGVAVLAAGLFYLLSVRGPLVTPALAVDTDSDGLEDAFENTYGTNPNAADSDGDTLSDWNEIFVTGTDPNNVDTDGDAVVCSQIVAGVVGT